MKYGYTIIYVSSVEETLEFYKRAFGFKIRFIHESKAYGELETGETTLAFASHEMGNMSLGGKYTKANIKSEPFGMELAEDSLTAREVIGGIVDATVVEEYPNYPKGPCVLLFQKDKAGSPIHVVWGIPKDHDKPAVLITAYRPDPARWDESFTRRR